MYRYSTVSTPEAAYFIGGTNTQEIIAEFKNDRWRRYGTLTRGRNYHGSILLDSEFMVIGGFSSDERLFMLLMDFSLFTSSDDYSNSY